MSHMKFIGQEGVYGNCSVVAVWERVNIHLEVVKKAIYALALMVRTLIRLLLPV